MPGTSGPTWFARSGRSGSSTVVLDDLSSGHREFVPDDVPLVVGSILDTDLVADRCASTGSSASCTWRGSSTPASRSTARCTRTTRTSPAPCTCSRPWPRRASTRSCSPRRPPSTARPTSTSSPRTPPTPPESPYGESKLIGEWLLADQARAAGLRHTSLRYFNVVGSATPDLYDTSPHNLFPLVLDALAAGRTPRINGTDYPTPDGTCVRDYIHVADLADSHVAAAQALAAGRTLEPVYNLGSGDGVSVREIMTAMAEATGIAFEPEIAPRRPGDPARIVASGELRRPRPRLADAPLAARHGHERLGARQAH